MKIRALLSSVIMLSPILGQAVKEAPPNEAVAFAATNPIAKPSEGPLENVKISGLYRIRPEIRENMGFSSLGNGNNANYIGQKLQVGFLKKFGNDVKLKITFQDSRIWGGNVASMTTLDTGIEQQALDVREAYLEFSKLAGGPLSIQVGRQKLVYGGERLIGGLDWTNIGRSFDAVRLKYETKTNKLHAFSSIVTEGNSADVGQRTFNVVDRYFSGIYNTFTGLSFMHVETYYLTRINTTNNNAEKLHTVGTRLSYKPKDVGPDYEIEAAYQFGQRNAMLSTSAYAGAAIVGYTLNPGIKMRLSFEADIASGDSNPNDNKFETFTNLYHTNHLYYGVADLISWQNMVSGAFHYQLFFSKKLMLKTSYLYVAKAVAADSWWQVSGIANFNNLIAGSTSKELFHEIDLVVNYKLYKGIGLQGGFSYVLRGAALKEAGRNADLIFSYFMMTAKF